MEIEGTPSIVIIFVISDGKGMGASVQRCRFGKVESGVPRPVFPSRVKGVRVYQEVGCINDRGVEQ
jgi:hypothetical protein